jgi:hypothetical protein
MSDIHAARSTTTATSTAVTETRLARDVYRRAAYQVGTPGEVAACQRAFRPRALPGSHP